MPRNPTLERGRREGRPSHAAFDLEGRSERLKATGLIRIGRYFEAATVSLLRAEVESVRVSRVWQWLNGFDFDLAHADQVTFSVVETSAVFSPFGDREMYRPEPLGGRPSSAVARWFVRRILTRSLVPGRAVTTEQLRSRLNAMGLGEHWARVGPELLAYASEGSWGGPILVQPYHRQWALAPWQALNDARHYEPLRLAEGKALFKAYYGAASRYWARREDRVGRVRALEELNRFEPSLGVRKRVLGVSTATPAVSHAPTQRVSPTAKVEEPTPPKRVAHVSRANELKPVPPVLEDGIVYALRVSLKPDRWDSLWIEQGRPVLRDGDLVELPLWNDELWWHRALRTIRMYEGWGCDLSDRWSLGPVGHALEQWSAKRYERQGRFRIGNNKEV